MVSFIRRISLPTWILPLARIFAHVRAEGREHLDAITGPVIFAANHQSHFDVPVGYSGHESGLAPTVGAVAMGACMIERHITLDRAMWGSDQAASVEPQGLMKLVRDTRSIEAALGDGVKKVSDDEIPIMKKLRRVG